MLCALVLALGLAVVGCGGGTGDKVAAGPRPLSTAEAERFAVARFKSYDVGMRTVDGTVIDQAGTVFLRGWIDTVDHLGYGLATPRGATSSSPFLLSWGPEVVNVQPFAGSTPPPMAPVDGWQHMALDPADSVLAAAQVLLVSLSVPQPENPLLLMQSGAQWLRDDVIGDVPVEVISGPLAEGSSEAKLRYWLDDTGTLLRLEAMLDGEHWSTFNFSDAPGTTFS